MKVDAGEVRLRLAAVVEAMKASGAWDVERPADEAFADMGAFGTRTMAFEQWLRYVLVPSIEKRLASGGPWPSSSSVAVQASREGDGDPRVAELVPALAALDELFEPEADGAPPALRLLEPPSRAAEPYERSRLAFARGDHGAALAAISEALLLDRRFPNAHNFAGWILFHWPSRTKAQLADAIAHFREAMKIAPEDGVPVANLCDALVAAGAEDEAVAVAEGETNSAEPLRAAFASNWLGWRALGRPETVLSAIDLFRGAVTRRPGWGVARANLAKALEMAHRSEEAYEEHARALACTDSFDRTFCFERRSAYEARCGRFQDALRTMRRAIAEERGGPRTATYEEAAAWIEAQLRAQGIAPPPEHDEDEDPRR